MRKSPSLHGRKSTPTLKFLDMAEAILSATLVQIFRFLWFMPLLGVRSPWFSTKWSMAINLIMGPNSATSKFASIAYRMCFTVSHRCGQTKKTVTMLILKIDNWVCLQAHVMSDYVNTMPACAPFLLGGIQQLRGPDYAHFWPTTHPFQRELKQMEPILRAKVKNFFKIENNSKCFL